MNSDARFTLWHTSEVGPRETSLPAITVGETPPYIWLKAGANKEVLKASVRRGASGDQIHVSLRAFPEARDGSRCSFSAASKSEYRRYWLFRDPAMTRAFLGLGLAVVGVLMEAALAIGRVAPIIAVSDVAIATTIFVSFLLKAVGLIITFLSVYTSKD